MAPKPSRLKAFVIALALLGTELVERCHILDITGRSLGLIGQSSMLNGVGVVVQSRHLVGSVWSMAGRGSTRLRVNLVHMRWHLVKGFRVEEDLVALREEKVGVVGVQDG